MKLAELLNVDTTKENWFKLLSKKGINPKTVNAVSKGGGGDGGVKEYYYKIINEDNRQYISNLVRTRINTILMYHNDTNIIKVNRIFYEDGNGFIEDYLSSCLAFSIYDDEAYILEDNQTYKLKKGNLIDKLDDYAKITNMPEEYKEQLQQIYNSTLQEITKEEYESLITQ